MKNDKIGGEEGTPIVPKIYRAKLTEEEISELQRRTRDPKLKPRTRDRLEMVRLSNAGFAIPKIAAITGASEQRVRHWIKRYLEGGFEALSDAAHEGPPSAITPAIVEAIKAEIRKQERIWTGPQWAEWLANEYGVKRTPGHLARRFKKEGMVWRRTTRSLAHKQEPAEVERKKAELTDFEKRGTRA